MKTLPVNWFIEGRIDAEQKQYVLLDYLQKVKESFRQNKLYPPFGNLIELYNGLVQFRENKDKISGQFPKKIQDMDLQKKILFYETLYADDKLMETVEQIIHWSLPLLRERIEEGRCMYEFVQDNMKIEEVGIVPLYVKEGYFCVPNSESVTLDVFEFGTSIYTGMNPAFSGAGVPYRSIYLQYITSFKTGLGYTPDEIKLKLIHAYPKFPNPLIYYLNTELEIPFQESILPVAKRQLMRKLHSGKEMN